MFMPDPNLNGNPFVQNTQGSNFQPNSGFNYNQQNTTSGIAPGVPRINQNIPPVPPTPPMTPNFPPMPPMPQNKSSGGLIIAIVVVLVLLLVSGLGLGGFVYWNNLQKQQSIENLSASINSNLEKYNALTEQSIQDLENLSKAFSSIRGSSLVEDLIRVFKDNKNALAQIEQKHQDLANTIDSADQELVKEFNDNLKEEIENTKQIITSSKILYETAFCYLSSVNDLDKSYLALTPLFNKLANSASSNQNYINTTNQILDEIRKMETASQAIISCLEQNPNFGSPTLISNLRSAQQDIAQMKQGLEIFKSGVQNNKMNDMERGSKMFTDAVSKLSSRRIDQSSLPDMPKETEKIINEYKQRVSSGKKALEEKKNQLLGKA